MEIEDEDAVAVEEAKGIGVKEKSSKERLKE